MIQVMADAFLPSVKVTEEQVKAYYESRAKEFAVPEQVRVEFVELSVDALAAKTPVDPEEVKKALEKGINVVGYDANSTPDARQWFVNQAQFNGIGSSAQRNYVVGMPATAAKISDLQMSRPPYWLTLW